MALPSRIFNYYTNLNVRISWGFREVGAVKGILNYYYKDWALLEDAHLLMIAGLSNVKIDAKKNVEVLSEMDFVENFFFSIGSFSKRWSCLKSKSQKELSFYIDQLSMLVSKGLFGTGIMMTPIITQFSLDQKTFLSFFLDYDEAGEEFDVLVIEENNTMVLKKIGLKQMERVKSLDYLAVELPTSSINKIHVMKRALFYSNLQSKYIDYFIRRNNESLITQEVLRSS